MSGIYKKSNFRFFEGGDSNFFDSLSVWIVEKKISDKKVIFKFPSNVEPLSLKSEHIFPSVKSISDFRKPYFHMGIIQPETGNKFNYSLIFQNKYDINFTSDSKEFIIKKDTITIISIESEFLHPSCFQAILIDTYNHLLKPNTKLEEVLNIFIRPKINIEPSASYIDYLPFNISREFEIGKFLHYTFSVLFIPDIIYIIKSLLIGSSIMITSFDSSKLCTMCFGIISLIYPLEWPNIFITSLPYHLSEVLSTPVPYIIGISHTMIDLPFVEYAQVDAIVNVDFHHIDKNRLLNNSRKTAKLDEYLQMLLELELDFYSKTGCFPAANIQYLIWMYMLSCLILAGEIDGEKKESPVEFIKSLIRKLTCNPGSSSVSGSFLSLLKESTVISYFSETLLEKDSDDTQRFLESVAQARKFLESAIE